MASQTNEPIRITKQDLYSPAVEQQLAIERELRRGTEDLPPEPFLQRLLYSSCFYLSVAGWLGAFVAWAILEPFYGEGLPGQAESSFVNYLIFPTVAAFIGLFLGTADGLICRNVGRALVCGAVGLAVGFAGGLVSLFVADVIFGVMSDLAVLFWENPQPGQMPTGLALLIFMMGRAGAWAVASVPAGVGQGLALREKQVVLNGVVGGVLGGLLGGLLFDPICMLGGVVHGEALVSRAVGFTCIGLFVGAFVGLVEGWTKTAWLLMRRGPLAGKQFVLYREATVLGSSPKADIYLFKDEKVEPRHAVIYNRGGRYEIVDCNTREGVYVNGYPVDRHWLQPGDRIVLGQTILEFAVRESRKG